MRPEIFDNRIGSERRNRGFVDSLEHFSIVCLQSLGGAPVPPSRNTTCSRRNRSGSTSLPSGLPSALRLRLEESLRVEDTALSVSKGSAAPTLNLKLL